MREKNESHLIVTITCGVFNEGAERTTIMMRKNFQSPTDEEIARYAYCLWEAEGRIHGRDLDYWLQAEAHLIAAREYEAGLLKDIEVSKDIRPQSIPAAIPSRTARPSRRRQSRIVQEAEPICA